MTSITSLPLLCQHFSQVELLTCPQNSCVILYPIPLNLSSLFFGVSFPPSFICQTHTHTSRPSSSIQTGTGTSNSGLFSSLSPLSLICTYLLATATVCVPVFPFENVSPQSVRRMTFLFLRLSLLVHYGAHSRLPVEIIGMNESIIS